MESTSIDQKTVVQLTALLYLIRQITNIFGVKDP